MSENAIAGKTYMIPFVYTHKHSGLQRKKNDIHSTGVLIYRQYYEKCIFAVLNAEYSEQGKRECKKNFLY